jgi:polysaccharide biosynthesis protein PelF
MTSLPGLSFRIFHVSPYPGFFSEPRYEMPDNVLQLEEVFCHAAQGGLSKKSLPKRPTTPDDGPPSRVLRALRRLHLGSEVDDELIADLATADLSVTHFLHGSEAFGLIRDELYEELAPGTPFTDFFWHMRAMHVPLLRLIGARAPECGAYHASSCGYAGLIGAIASERTGRPLMVTEHGIYARERELELARASWIRDFGHDRPPGSPIELSPLRRIWAHYFTMLSRIAYWKSKKLITLSAVNRERQIVDGANEADIEIIPNGVDMERFSACVSTPRHTRDTGEPIRLGFIGRVVPIKDVLTLIRAIHLAYQTIDLEVWIVGPEDEDPGYAARCHELVDLLGVSEVIQFLGPRDVREIYGEIDVLLLTSISEGQPLVILEAYAAAVPVISTDVGACRELIEGAGGMDAELGPSGIVTRIASPVETAQAIVDLARDPQRRLQMGRAGLARVEKRYLLGDLLVAYERLYRDMLSA